jgi:hypothetical protein
VVLVVYLAVLGVAVFGPAPVEEIQGAARGLRELEQEVRERLGNTTETAAPATTAPVAPTPTATIGTTAPPTPSPIPPPAPSPSTTATAPASGGRRWDVGAEEAFNALAFVPLGLLLPLCWPRWRWLTVLVGAQLSGTIELVQAWFLDWRSPTITDVRWNTTGTIAGFSAWLAQHAFAPRLAQRMGDPSGPARERARRGPRPEGG